MRCNLPKAGRQTQAESLSTVIWDLTLLCLAFSYSSEKKEAKDEASIVEDQPTTGRGVGEVCVMLQCGFVLR